MKDVVRFLGIVFLVAAIATTMACGDAGGGGGGGSNKDHPDYNPELPDAPGVGDGTGIYAKEGISPWGGMIWDPGNECANFACWEAILTDLLKVEVMLSEACAEKDCKHEPLPEYTGIVEQQYLNRMNRNWEERLGTASQKGVHDPSTTQHANHPLLQGFTAFPCTNENDRARGMRAAECEIEFTHN